MKIENGNGNVIAASVQTEGIKYSTTQTMSISNVIFIDTAPNMLRKKTMADLDPVLLQDERT